MQSARFQDRRIFERIPVRFPVDYLNLNSQQNSQAQTYDISADGLGLVTNEDLPACTPVDIRLHISDDQEPFSTKGRVAWSKIAEHNKYRAGIKLDKVELIEISRVLNRIKDQENI